MSLRSTLRSLPARLLAPYRRARRAAASLIELRELTLAFQTRELQRSHPNPLNRFGRQCFSQSDEDGITLEILRRLGRLEGGTFAEFGVGDGMENNTLILKALGWRGFWVGKEALAFPVRQPRERFCHLRDWVTLENVAGLAEEGLRNLGAEALDVISMDLDGNDLYLAERLLERGLKPKLFIIEYNAKFPPPLRWQMDYDARHTWKGDDYFGASLASLDGVFSRHGFRLACCNAHTGANAFFVREDCSAALAGVPADIGEIYAPPRYELLRSFGHRRSARTVAKLFA